MSLAAFVRAVTSLHGRSDGLAAWSVLASETKRVALPTKDAQTGNAHCPLASTETSVLRYKLVWNDAKVSRGSVERTAFESRPREIIAQARFEATEDPDSAYVLQPAPLPDVLLYDDEVARLISGDLTPWSRRLGRFREIVAGQGFRTWSGSLAASTTSARVLASSGIDAAAHSSSASWWTSLDGEHGDGDSGRSLDTEPAFEARLERMARTALLLRTPADGGPSGLRDVLLHPTVVTGLVLGSLVHHLDGKTVHHGEGRFRKEQFGGDQPVLREDLTLRLDPLRPLHPGSYRFTEDGLPAARCDYLRDGRLASPIVSLKYAKALGLAPTPLPHGDDSLVLEAGPALTLDEAFLRAPNGALILSVLGLHTQDAASGDFSLSAPQVLRIEPNGPTGRFRATVSGNVFDLLRSEALRLVAFPGERHPGILARCRLDPR